MVIKNPSTENFAELSHFCRGQAIVSELKQFFSVPSLSQCPHSIKMPQTVSQFPSQYHSVPAVSQCFQSITITHSISSTTVPSQSYSLSAVPQCPCSVTDPQQYHSLPAVSENPSIFTLLQQHYSDPTVSQCPAGSPPQYHCVLAVYLHSISVPISIKVPQHITVFPQYHSSPAVSLNSCSNTVP